MFRSVACEFKFMHATCLMGRREQRERERKREGGGGGGGGQEKLYGPHRPIVQYCKV